MLAASTLRDLQAALKKIEARRAELDEQAQLLRAVIARFGAQEGQREELANKPSPTFKMQHLRNEAERILQDAGEPLHYREIHRRLTERGIEVGGKDPARTVGAQLSADHDRFKSVGGGKWTLIAGFPAPRQQPVNRPIPVPLERRPAFPLALATATTALSDSSNGVISQPVVASRQLPPWEDDGIADVAFGDLEDGEEVAL